MEIDAFSVILTCFNLLLVQGSDLKTATRRVIYGQPAEVSEFPFLVRIDTEIGPVCSGAIIAEYWIVTAGHCVKDHVCSEDMDIFPAVWPSSESIKPVDCFAHSMYGTVGYEYDIGLMRVGQDLLRDDRLRAIPLPQPHTTYLPGTKAVFAGWGQTEHDPYAMSLLKGEFVVREWDFCNKENLQVMCKYDPNPDCVLYDIPRTVLCIQGVGMPPAGTCFGDSGGPVIVNDELAGIDSFGIATGELTCAIGAPSMHTHVPDYLPWIYTYVAPGVGMSRT